MRSLLVVVWLVLVVLGFSAYAAYTQLTLSIGDIHGPAFYLKNIRVQHVDQKASELVIHIEEFGLQDEVWRDVTVSCDQFDFNMQHVNCIDGYLNLSRSTSFPIAFQFDRLEQKLRFDIKPTVTESWQVTADWDEEDWQVKIDIVDGQVAHLKYWLPVDEAIPVLTDGRITLNAELNGHADVLTQLLLDVQLDALSFSDQVGLHAGEGVKMRLNTSADFVASDQRWQWQTEIKWLQGEVFWQPLYLTGDGHQITLNGSVTDNQIDLHEGRLMLSGVGLFEFSGAVESIDKNQYALQNFDLTANNTELSALFDQFLKPFLQDSAFADLVVSGKSDLAWRYKDGVSERLTLDLDDVSVIDQRGRFAFNRVDAHIPWRMDAVTIADVYILDGHVLQIPFGTIRVPLEIRGFNLLIPQLALPVLDGALELEHFVASYQQGRWYWSFNGELEPVSMAQLTQALQVQEMHGTLSAHIPQISYDGAEQIVSLEGELLFNVFDGNVVVNNLSLLEPMGFVPHLKANVTMRNLDLDLLTRTFSFGKMEGRIDIDMRNMELSGWQPIYFDARLTSSPGDYRRRISQAAVENISALGGESAVAAVQRSVLRFFETFRYSEIGWRCILEDNICSMAGIENHSDSDDYTLVKGSGIPVITVRGYNREVDWKVLVDRLKRVAQENEPIIQ